MKYRDRADAAAQLADELVRHRPDGELVVLGLPRGGVPMARIVGDRLGAPVDVIVVRKLGVPGHAELAMGAIGEGPVRVLNDDLVQRLAITPEDVAAVEAVERSELERRAGQYRPHGARTDLAGRTAVIVDDGVATGATARAACAVARAAGARQVVLAVPVAPADVNTTFADVADRVACLQRPHRFRAVGQFYARFDAVTDAEVVAALTR